MFETDDLASFIMQKPTSFGQIKKKKQTEMSFKWAKINI